jgi:pimeloyl-ACP methyl ester carboxylesterase
MNNAQAVTRRQALAAMAASALTISTLGNVAKGAEMNQTTKATFVLVHGAWHGGWCWKKLTPLLRAAGHEVFAPTLTGMGERAHLINPQINLDTHIQDITNVLEYEDLQNVILVGHSYGGMVISGVAAKAGERLAQLVYLDAFLPENGKALQDYAPPLAELVDAQGAGWRLSSAWMGTPTEMFGVKGSADLAWVTPRLGDQPYGTFTQPVQLALNPSESLRQSYIALTAGPPFEEAAARAKQQGFRSYELFSAGHDAMVTQPKELAKILLALL